MIKLFQQIKSPLTWKYLQLAVAAGLLWYVLKDINYRSLLNEFAQADYLWLLAFSVGLFLFYLMRAARWRLTLQALDYYPSLFRVTVALLAGTLASMVFPGAGEFTRCTTLQRTDGVPVSTGLGLVVAERIIDLLMLGVLCGLTFLVEARRVGAFLASVLTPTRNKIAAYSQHWPWLLLLGGLLILAIYWLWRHYLVRQPVLMGRLSRIGKGVAEGLASVYRLKRPLLFVILTVFSYVVQVVCTYMIFLAMPAMRNLPVTAALTILTLSSLGGLAVPTQGGIGTFHFLISRAMVLYGLTLSQGTIIATFMHAVSFGVGLLLSVVSFMLVPFLIRKKDRKKTITGHIL